MKRHATILLVLLLTLCALTGHAAQNQSAAYAKLIAYKTENYAQQSVAEFNAALASTPDELTEFLAAYADAFCTISPDDENYEFFATTLDFSSKELYCAATGEELAFFTYVAKNSRPFPYLDEYGEFVYDFRCTAELQVGYALAPARITVAERDAALLTFRDELQAYLDGLSEAEITGGDIRSMLAGKADEIANRLSSENMRLFLDYMRIEISD